MTHEERQLRAKGFGIAQKEDPFAESTTTPCRYACSAFPMCGCEVEALNPPAAFEEGMDAFRDRRVVNPFPDDSPEFRDWQDGYESASDGAWDVWLNGL